MSKSKDKKEFQKFSDITEATKEEWRSKYGRKVKTVEIPIDEDVIDGEVATFVLKKPDRRVVEAVSKYGVEKKFGKANEVMIKNCVLGGDMKYLDEEAGDDDVYHELMAALGEMIGGKRHSIKKL